MTSNAAYVVHEGGALISLTPTATAALESSTNYFDAAVHLPASKVILHVRFWPDATIWEIAERPSTMTKEEWFAVLCARVGERYETRAGGRGFFRMSSFELDSIKAQSTH
jgi:hypothetical protein